MILYPCSNERTISKSVSEALFFISLTVTVVVFFLRSLLLTLINGVYFGPVVSEDVEIKYNYRDCKYDE